MDYNGIRYYFSDINSNIGIKKCSNSIHSSKAHFHNEVSIALVNNGISNTEINDKIYEITSTTFLMIPPGVVHKCNPQNLNDWNFIMLYINAEWFKSAFDIRIEEIGFSSMKLDRMIYKKILKTFNNIEKNIVDIEFESKLLDYISLLMNSRTTRELSETLNVNRLYEIKKFLDDTYLTSITLNDLVKISGISKYYLIRQFENLYGLSPHKYLTNLRVNYSKTLLKNSNDFASIALESGFYDQSHFTKCFKEYTGVTPKKYKSNFSL